MQSLLTLSGSLNAHSGGAGKPASDFSPRGRSNAWVDMLHGEAGTPPGGHDRYSESVEVEGEKNQLLDGRESVSDGQRLRGAV